MNQCLNERTLLRITTGEGTAAHRAHLRVCADCAERFDALADDLDVIGNVLMQTPPRTAAVKQMPWTLLAWAPVAVAAVVVLAVGLMVTRQFAPTPVQVAARSGNVPAFAADVSAALFASGDDDFSSMQLAADAPYLRAALEVGLPCTQERFLDGECDDQVSALVFESD